MPITNLLSSQRRENVASCHRGNEYKIFVLGYSSGQQSLKPTLEPDSARHRNRWLAGLLPGLSSFPAPQVRTQQFYQLKKSTVLEAPPEPPQGWVGLKVMRRHFWPYEDTRPSDFKIRWLCQHDGLPHLRFGTTYYFRLADVEAYLKTHTIPAKRPTAGRPRKEVA